VVPGGWTDEQVAERRGPTTAELDAHTANPTYVQCAYRYGVLNSPGLVMADIRREDGTLHDGVEVDPGTGAPTGRVLSLSSLMRILDGIIGEPGIEEEMKGTMRFLAELRSLGLVGALDAGGFRTHPESYDAVYELARRESLDFRLRVYVHPGEPGNQVDQVRQWVRHARPRTGHPYLDLVGIGEVVHYECHDQNGYDLGFRISEEAKEELSEISRLAARYGWSMHAHAIQDTSVGDHLDVWETLDDGAPGRNRFSIAHGELTGVDNLRRMSRLGVGIGVQARMFDTGLGASRAWGEAFVDAPRIGSIEELGIPLGGGTDGAVGHTYNPWEALSWFVTGRGVADIPERAVEHRLSRSRALDVYSNGSAWFSFEEHERGRLTPGYLGDLAILEKDYFEIPDDEIAANSAWMTIVGGRVVHG
jgi:predicted amidohydrolase YtcJ